VRALRNSAALAEMVKPASDVATGGASLEVSGTLLPTRVGLASVLPWRGLRRGSTVVVRGSVSLLFALLSEATAHGPCPSDVCGGRSTRCGAAGCGGGGSRDLAARTGAATGW
jgi:hypothetical protein